MQRICEAYRILKFVSNLHPSSCLSLRTKQLNYLNYPQKIHVSLTSNEGSGERTVASLCLSVHPSVCVSMKQLFCHWMGFDKTFLNKFSKMSRNFNSNYYLTKITDSLHLNICSSMIKYHSIIIKIKLFIVTFTFLFKALSYVQ